VVGGRPRRREVAGGDHATLRSRARVGRDTQLWADMGDWQVGPPLILFLKFQNHPNFVIQFGDFSFVQNSPKFERR
jgi:hypothetical protein